LRLGNHGALQLHFTACRYVYAPLPPATSYGHRAESWNPDKWMQVGIRVSTIIVWFMATIHCQALGPVPALSLTLAAANACVRVGCSCHRHASSGQSIAVEATSVEHRPTQHSELGTSSAAGRQLWCSHLAVVSWLSWRWRGAGVVCLSCRKSKSRWSQLVTTALYAC
jgi:hypothetical protein